MINEIQLKADYGGIVIFSPAVLNRFVQERCIHTKNLLKHFICYEHYGKAAIEEGIVMAIYRIPKQQYRVVVTDETDSKNIPDDWMLFSYTFPLEVKNKVVISDVSSLMNWNSEDWKDSEQISTDGRTTSCISLESGPYLLRVSGFNEDARNPGNNYGYLLEFIQVQDFSFFTMDEKVLDSLDYHVLPDPKINEAGSLPEKSLFNYMPLLEGKPEDHFDGQLYTLENVRINMLQPHNEIERYDKLGPFRTGTKRDEVLKALKGKKYISYSDLFRKDIQIEDMEYEGVRWDVTCLYFRFDRLYGVEFMKAAFPGEFTPHLNHLCEQHIKELLLQKLPSGKYKYQTIYDERSKLSPFFSIGGETTTHIYIYDNDGTSDKLQDGSNRYWHRYYFCDLRATGNYFATRKKKGIQELSDVIFEKPVSWGLRGDPYLWQELKKRYEYSDIDSPEEFREILYGTFEIITRNKIEPGKNYYVPAFNCSGMLSGYICSDFWLETGFPLLLERFEQIMKENRRLPDTDK